ncbi:glycine--tRNA ligase subunit beta [Domibacillus enclensis]|uniref:Glycine--tRNA ligase beta subunit n=1 Tax=Domibacillus enclensis TaxID=1017273 RepID=A0A1N6PP04_9BACI|nr:glycine--tRNA ligase subunit beta [Domibacillus enclensis]OXS80436.1 glycine--tRNA ligase subunit beta [Domibacillus enclensis]SIQ06095.1 glycyl-tRNA synthetase beta chain [Domibacillus enclensis]
MSKHLLIEIGLEEMPARFVTQSMNQLGEKTAAFLKDRTIEFSEVKTYSTPRRLAVIVKDVAESQADVNEEAKGPAKKIALTEDGEWSKAAAGFARGQGMSTDDIYFKEIKGIEYAHVKKFVEGQETALLLTELKDVILSMTFGKNMRWGSNDIRYVRPIKWIAALFGQEVVSFEAAGVQTGNTTSGHRFLGGQAVIIEADEYVSTLKEQFVIADPDERRRMIVTGLEELEKQNGWTIPVDESLLEEVNNLVEYPTALSGSYNEEFLDLPEEVLITSMKEHQRYFPVRSAEGVLLPHFVTVRNGNSHAIEKVARGNEKVLRARLADADFFYKEDQKTPISDSLEKLERIVYHEKIGTLSEKVGRIRRVTNRLAKQFGVSADVKKQADRAAEICKFDLVTQMVYEFPELQGVMGEKYARQKGEKEEVAVAINEHYMPRSADDHVPATAAGALVSLADKLDTIVSCFAVGIIPTGSQDPYALRRQAAGIVQTMMEHNWNVALSDVLTAAIEEVKADGVGDKGAEALQDELTAFFALRVKHILQEKGIRYDLIDAVLSKTGTLSDMQETANVLMSQKDEQGFKVTMEALSRVVNISKKADGPLRVDPALFENEQEKDLYDELKKLEGEWNQSGTTAKSRYDLLASLQPAIERYFEHTMVMTEDEALKQNRLAVMQNLARFILDFAEVPAVLVK